MKDSYDIWMQAGDSFNLSLTATDSQNNLLNLSGFIASGGVKYSYGSSGYLINLNPQIDPSFISGLITVSVPASMTTGIPITKGVYDIQVINTGSNYTFKVLRGYANINPSI